MRNERFNVKTPIKLIIGDPMYLEAIENKTDRGCEKEITFIRKQMPANVETTIIVKEVEDICNFDGKEIAFSVINVNIIGISNRYNEDSKARILDAFINGQYYPSLLKKQGELGCDTACFVMETNLGYEEFHTGADGYYGCYMLYKDSLAYNIELSLSTDMFDFDNVVKTMKYLFKEI